MPLFIISTTATTVHIVLEMFVANYQSRSPPFHSSSLLEIGWFEITFLLNNTSVLHFSVCTSLHRNIQYMVITTEKHPNQ